MNETAIYIHAYHLQHMPEIMRYVGAVNVPFDLIVSTTPDRIQKLNQIEELTAYSPMIEVVENRGRDILPFLKMLPVLSRYKAVCKIHTKRDEAWRGPDQANHSMSWREHMLASLLTDAKSATSRLTDLYAPSEMRSHATIASMYRHPVGQSTLYHLTRIIRFYKVNLSVAPFPVGTFFWVRPDKLSWLLKDGYDGLFEREAGLHGGQIENAFEVAFVQMARNPTAISSLFGQGVDAYISRDRTRAREIWLSAEDEYSQAWAEGVTELLEHRGAVCVRCMNLQDDKCILTGASFPELTRRGGRGCPIDLWKR